MIYEELYKPAISAYVQKWESYFAAFTIKDFKTLSIIGMRDELEARKAQLATLKSCKPDNFEFDLTVALDEKFASAIAGYTQAVAEVHSSTENKKRQLDERHRQAIEEADRVAENSVSDLTKKYDRLFIYKDKVADAIIRYNIVPSNLHIDEENLSRADMEALIDASLRACKSIGDDTIREKLSVLYKSADDSDQDQRLAHAVAVIVGAVLISPIILALLFGYMFWRVSSIYQNIEGLRIADKLMYGINFSKFRDIPKYEDIPDVDYTEVEEQERVELERIAVGDPSKAKEQLQREINKNHSKIAEDFRSATNHVMGKYDALLRVFEEGIAALQKIINDYIANMKDFGSYCSDSLVMDTQFTLGKQKGTLDVKYDMGLRNIVFASRSPEMMLFIKLMLANAMLSVRPKQFSCVIYDPEGLGADFATFMSQETSDYMSVETKDFNKILDSYRTYSQMNLRILDQKDINTFNKEAAEKGMVTLDYKLLILISGVDKPLDNRILTEFMQFSARTGSIVWLVNSSPVPECTFYKEPFSGINEPYPVSPGLFSKVMQTYMDAFNNGKEVGILYKSAFADRYLPREKWWQENTDKGIKLNFGLQDGDPSKGYDLELGDANVHCLCVGATGAGKSAFINQMLLSLITRYPPSTLELVMVDFKNIEFATLTNLETHISRIPHAKILAGTKDGEYAISIFDYLLEEMDRRTKLFAEVGAKKLETYNQRMRQMGTSEKCLPRILVIIDEFQVMFTEVDQKSVEIIQGRIRSEAKLARFCGCHLLFCSQSMKGTMPKDIMDQFSLRVCLRCSSDTSTEILGSPIASKIKQKFGYLYTNTNAGETQDSTRLWRTPFASEKVIYDTLDEVNTLCEERREVNHRAYFYDEKEKYSGNILKEWFDRNKALMGKEQRLIVLGERTSFSQNNAPVNFRLKRADGENIFFYGFEEADFNNLCMTFVDNISANPTAQLLINCADTDLFMVLDVESWYSKDFLDIAKPMTSVAEWVGYLLEMIQERESADPDSYGPLYFMCLRWDKQLGICRDERYDLTDKWKSVIMKGPAVDIHIVFGAQLFKEIPAGILTLFNHIICARGPEDAGYKFMNSAKMAKLPDELGFAIYQYGSADKKFKIYQHTFMRKAEEREIRL